MVAGAVQAADPAIDARILEMISQIRRDQEVVDPQTLVPGPALAQIRPIGPRQRIGMERPHSVGPALIQQALERSPALRPQQGVVAIGMAGVDVGLGRDDIVVAGQHDGRAAVQQGLGVDVEGVEPGQLVVELWAGIGIAVGQVQATDQHAVHRRLDVAGLALIGIGRQGGASENRRHAARQDRHAIPGPLTFPNRAITHLLEGLDRKPACSVFNSCRQTTSGWAASNHSSRMSNRLRTLLMLKVAIRTQAQSGSSRRRSSGRRGRWVGVQPDGLRQATCDGVSQPTQTLDVSLSKV